MRQKPGASRQYVAASLGLPENQVRGVLERHELSRLNPRLRFGGSDPHADVPSDLLTARQRYKPHHQSCPGWLIHSDQKLLTRIVEDGQQVKMHCFAVIVNFSPWASLHYAPVKMRLHGTLQFTDEGYPLWVLLDAILDYVLAHMHPPCAKKTKQNDSLPLLPEGQGSAGVQPEHPDGGRRQSGSGPDLRGDHPAGPPFFPTTEAPGAKNAIRKICP